MAQEDKTTGALQLLLRANQLLLQEKDLNKALTEISLMMSSFIGADECSLMLFDTGKQTLTLQYSSGLTQWEIENITFKMGQGIAGWVAEQRVGVLIEDVTQDQRFTAFSDQEREIRSMICVPLKAEDKILGVLSATSSLAHCPFSERDKELLQLLALNLSLTLENQRLYFHSILDPLTQCYNRLYLDHRIAKELSYCSRSGAPLSLAMLDIDHFKSVNDNYGHTFGDLVLRSVANAIHDTLRDYDIIARYGGEEFCILLINTELADALKVCERIRKCIEELKICSDEEPVPIRASIGITQYNGSDKPLDLIKRADQALYLAKSMGRNQVQTNPSS